LNPGLQSERQAANPEHRQRDQDRQSVLLGERVHRGLQRRVVGAEIAEQVFDADLVESPKETESRRTVGSIWRSGRSGCGQGGAGRW
jgi:hypothetical protein